LPFFSTEARKLDQIVAIDLGSRSTKAVHLQRKGERLNLLSYAIMDALSTEKAPSAEAMTEHLRNIAQELKTNRGRQVMLALGVTDSLTRQVEVPMMPAADIRQMLKFNSKTYLQQDLPDYVFDCHCLPLAALPAPAPATPEAKPAEAQKPSPLPTKMRAVVGGAKRQLVDGWASAVRGAGLVPESIFPGLLGPTNAFEMCEPEVFRKEVIALVDIGFKNTTVSLLQGGEIMLNRVVAIGGDHITSGLAEAMNISYAEAEGIKIGMPSEVQQHLETILNPLGRELRASIDFFEHQNDKTVNQVLLSGGSARSDFIVQCLQTELMVPCRSWNSARFLELALAPEKMGEIEQVARQLTVAIGAATSIF